MSIREKKELLLISSLILVAIFLRILFFFYTEDDAFITFRYVKNFLDGKGLVYNLGENVLGITNGLYALLLIIFGKLGLNFISFGKIFNILSDGISVLLILMIVRKWGGIKIWVLPSLLFVVSPPNIGWSASGMETSFYILFLFLSLYCYLDKKFILLGISAGILFLIRPDGGQLLFILFLDYLLFDILKPVIGKKNSLSKTLSGLFQLHKYAIVTLLLFLIVILPWLIFCYTRYGSILPNSIKAKFVTYPGTPEGSGFFDPILYFVSPGPKLILTIFFLIGIVGSKTNRCHRIVSAYFLFSLLLMATSHVHLFPWYFAPLLPFYYIVASKGIELIILELEKISSKWRIKTGDQLEKNGNGQFTSIPIFLNILIVVIIVLSMVSIYKLYTNLKIHSESLQACHKAIGEWLKENTDEDSIVCVGDIGYIGYYSDRKILDFMGLVSPEVLPFWEKGTPQEIVSEFKPDYFVVSKSDYFYSLVKDKSWFGIDYKIKKEFEAGDYKYYVFIREKMLDRQYIYNN